MLASIKYKNKKYKIDLSKPLDISIPLSFNGENPNAWYAEQPKIEPFKMGNWIGSIAEGGDVNYKHIWFSPHANGTHTETVGHITKDMVSINKNLTTFFFTAEVITVSPKVKGEDTIITKSQLKKAIKSKSDAIVIRTNPNTNDKLTKAYSHTNPTYLSVKAAVYLRKRNVKHLLIDLPSIDKEIDEGKLAAHNEFWNTKNEVRLDATITEFIYVNDEIEDGKYILNLQIASFENDATPSKPILYKLIDKK